MEEYEYDRNLFVNEYFQRDADAVCDDFDKNYPPMTIMRKP